MNAPPGLGAAEAGRRRHLSDLLLDVTQAMAGHISEVSTSLGLTPMQALLLHCLDTRAPLPMSELARKLHCDTSNATGLVDRLEQQRLITRVTPPNDRRVRAVELTEQGARVRAELDERIRGANPLFDGLDPAAQRQLAELLEQLLGADVSSRGHR